MKSKEALEQTTLFEWAKWKEHEYPELKLMYHVPNGGSRNKLEAINLKRQGVKAGVPDICLPVAAGDKHGMYIEMKAGKNKPTESQTAWLEQLNAEGYLAIVCWSFEEARDAILHYLNS